jgi:hypothetical protein
MRPLEEGAAFYAYGDDNMTLELALTVLLIIGVFLTVYELEMIRQILTSKDLIRDRPKV